MLNPCEFFNEDIYFVCKQEKCFVDCDSCVHFEEKMKLCMNCKEVSDCDGYCEATMPCLVCGCDNLFFEKVK